MLTRLPEYISKDYKATLLNGDDGEVAHTSKIFLDQADRPFRRYQLHTQEESGPSLPFVLHRENETIPAIVGEGRYVLGHGLGFTQEPRKRLGFSGEERDPKRRAFEYSD